MEEGSSESDNEWQQSIPRNGAMHFPSTTHWSIKKTCWLGDMKMKDGDGNLVFKAENQMGSWAWNFQLYDMRSGGKPQRIGQIKQTLRWGLPKFIVSIGNGSYFLNSRLEIVFHSAQIVTN